MNSVNQNEFFSQLKDHFLKIAEACALLEKFGSVDFEKDVSLMDMQIEFISRWISARLNLNRLKERFFYDRNIKL